MSVAFARASLSCSPLAAGVWLVGGAGANVVAVEGPSGLTLIDGGLARHARELQSCLKASTNQQVGRLINTHWHEEQTGANAFFGKAGVPIIAHEFTRQWMRRPVHLAWQSRTVPAAPPVALPTRTFRSTLSLDDAGQPMNLGWLGQAHTDTDIYVHLPGSDLLVVGDVLAPGRFPILDYSTGGWIGGLIEATRSLMKLAGPTTRVVPADGPVADRTHLETQLQMLETLRERLWQFMRQGRTETEIIAAKPAAEFEARLGDPLPFITAACKGLWSHARENRGVI
jgi:glyoxylase-like metal-dependent hydrolase (beta-lactamase superfamily II)